MLTKIIYILFLFIFLNFNSLANDNFFSFFNKKLDFKIKKNNTYNFYTNNFLNMSTSEHILLILFN